MSKVLRPGMAALAVAASCLWLTQAHAGWGSYGGSYGSYGHYAGYGSSGYGSSGYYSVSYGSYGASYGSSGHVGPVRRVLGGVARGLHNLFHPHHRVYYGSYGSSGSSGSYVYRSYGSSGYYYGASSGSYYGGSSGSYYGGSSGSFSGGSSGYYYGSASTSNVGYGSYASSNNLGSGYRFGSSTIDASYVSSIAAAPVDQSEIHLTVSLPEDAKVFVNGNPTTSTGATRHYVSRGVAEQGSYRFDIRAEVERNGKTLVESKSIVLSGGQAHELRFELIDPDEAVETALTLNVPDGATVSLAGNSTKTGGQVRTYRTRELRRGEAWDNYVIRVEHEGQVKEQTVRLIGGDSMTMSFNFDSSEEGSSRLALK